MFLVVGAGGLGGNGIQIVKAFGGKVTVLDKKQKARDQAKNWVLMRSMMNYQQVLSQDHLMFVLILFLFKPLMTFVKVL